MLGHGRSERRWQEENLDEYEEEVEEDEEERYAEEGEEDEEEEEEEEAEEELKPTAEELEYLTMRERMKAKLRLKLQKENAALLGRSGASGDHRRTLQNAEFGSFFGPSKPAIARRVIEERHSLQETQHMRAKEMSSSNIEKRGHAAMNVEKREHISSNGHAKNDVRADHLKAVKEIRSKAQALKDMRDYSFLLSDDADVPAPAREPPPRKPSVPLTDARPAQTPQRTKAEVNRHAAAASESRVLKKPASVSQKIPPPKVPQKPPLISRPNPMLSVPKNISNGTVANGPSRLPNGKAEPASSHQNMLVRKSSATSMNKPASLDRKPVVSGSPASLDRKPIVSGSSSQAQNLERRKEIQVLSRERLVAKQPMPSSRLQQQISSTKPKPKPLPQSQLQPQSQPRCLPQQSMSSSKTKLPAPEKKSQLPVSKTKPSKPIAQQRPPQKPLKRKHISRYSDDDDEGGAAISMIRRMFGYDPKKYAGDDEDDSDMEANFDDIQMEERRSLRIAQQEDEEQLRLIEEEERRERMRKMAKKRKLG